MLVAEPVRRAGVAMHLADPVVYRTAINASMPQVQESYERVAESGPLMDARRAAELQRIFESVAFSLFGPGSHVAPCCHLCV